MEEVDWPKQWIAGLGEKRAAIGGRSEKSELWIGE